MRTPTVLVLLAVLAATLAGCAGKGPKAETAGPDFSGLNLDATASTGVIRGLVVDAGIHPLKDANVTLTPGNATTKTTADGLFGFTGLAPGTYFVHVDKQGYVGTQSSADVVAGNAAPPVVRIVLTIIPSLQPYIETLVFHGFLSFGAAIGITSVGTTINPALSESMGDVSIWTVNFTQVPTWAQGELVWEQNQPAGGDLIWEMVVGGSNDHKGVRTTGTSPALAYWNTTVLQEEAENVTKNGIAYRFFGGPHPATYGDGSPVPPPDQCPTVPTVVLGNRNPCTFGYGLTVQQAADAYVHHFYNFAPPEGWRFTKDGDPVVPSA